MKDFFERHDLDITVIESILTGKAPALLRNKSEFSQLLKL